MASKAELEKRLIAAQAKLAEAEQDLAQAEINQEGGKVIKSCREAVRRQRIRVSNLETDISKLK